MLEFEIIEPIEVQIEELYELLKSRSHSISHKELPEFETHATFVRNHPYRAWYLVRMDQELIGSVYLGKDNSIGVQIDEAHVGEHLHIVLTVLRMKHKPLEPIPSVRPAEFFVNVAPSNKALIAALEKLEYPLIQHTYRINA